MHGRPAMKKRTLALLALAVVAAATTGCAVVPGHGVYVTPPPVVVGPPAVVVGGPVYRPGWGHGGHGHGHGHGRRGWGGYRH